MTHEFHSWAYSQRKPQFKKIHTTQCSLQHYLQQLEHGSNLNIHQQRNDKEDVLYEYTHTQCNITILLSHEKEQNCYVQRHGQTQRLFIWSLLSCAQSYLTLCDPMDCSAPGSSFHGDSPGKNTGVGCHFLHTQ